MKAERFLYGKISLNLLAKDLDNAREIYEATEGHVIVGILSANYPDAQTAIKDMREFDQALGGAVSVGLGAGDPGQSSKVLEILRDYKPEHVNQVFPAVGASRALVGEAGSFINALVQPTGRPGFVNIATGPRSRAAEPAVVPVETAIELVRDMGGNSLKFFPMGGLASRTEYEAVARTCASLDFALEPTGGIDVDNFEEILDIALAAGVPRVIPHVYSSIIDKATGKTRLEDVKQIYEIMKSKKE